MNVAALCAGYGGLELGLGLTGVDVDLTWYAETDPHASAVMAAHHPNVPNLGDLTAITNPPPVDIVTAGFPCQPVSNAGKRKGIHDERWLIDDVCTIGRRTGADRLILENVGGLLSANNGDAMARVLSALAENGFDARWTCVRASDVGAPHQRLRWFCVATKNAASDGWQTGSGTASQVPGDRTRPEVRPCGPASAFGGAAATDADGASVETRSGGGHNRQRIWEEPLGSSTSAPDTDGGGHGGTQNGGRVERLDGSDEGTSRVGERAWQVAEHRSSPPPNAERFGPYADAVQRWEPIVGRAAPDPTDNQRRLNPRFVEWMMGLPDGHVTDIIERRGPALKILGNGVVPQQAAHALTLLEQI